MGVEFTDALASNVRCAISRSPLFTVAGMETLCVVVLLGNDVSVTDCTCGNPPPPATHVSFVSVMTIVLPPETISASVADGVIVPVTAAEIETGVADTSTTVAA
jgi:hypothetical protein